MTLRIQLGTVVGVVLAVLGSVAAQACYYPDGSLAPDQFRCTTDADESFCCPDSEHCLENKLCYFNSTGFDDIFRHFYYRGSCTDQSWESEECPNYCIDSPDGRDLAWQCNEEDATYQCQLNYYEYEEGGELAEEACAGPSVFTLPGSSTIIPWPSTTESFQSESANTPITEFPTLSSVTRGLQTGEPSGEDTSQTSTTTNAPPTTASETVASRTSESSESSTSDPSGSNSGTNGSSDLSTGVGIGVGVGLGVAVLGAVAAAIFFWRRRRARRTGLQQLPNGEFSPGVGPGGFMQKAPNTVTQANWNGTNYGYAPSIRHEAPNDAMRHEAPHDAMRYEAPDAQRYEAPNAERYEAPAVEIGGRHELPGR